MLVSLFKWFQQSAKRLSALRYVIRNGEDEMQSETGRKPGLKKVLQDDGGTVNKLSISQYERYNSTLDFV